MSTSTKPHILIVGAGLGGLTLAQALRKQGISFEIFERSADDRFQGWAIGIHSILEELVGSFPSDMPPIAVVDHLLPLSLPAQLIFYRNNALQPRYGVEDDGSKAIIRANRQRFRSWLATKISIQFDKAAVRVEESKENATVHFQDGTSATGDIIVGADGVSSVVRRYLIPDLEPVRVLPMATLVGELALSGRDFEKQLELGHSAYIASDTASADPAAGVLFAGLNSVSDDAKSGNYYWSVTYADPTVASPPHWTSSASKEELFKLAVDKTQHLLPEFRSIVNMTGPEGIVTTPFMVREVEIESLAAGRVTLLGDAAHCMTPFRGEGGVHAMRDGLNLARTISNIATAGAGEEAVKQGLADYQREMLERGRNAIELSRGNWGGSAASSETQKSWGKPMSVIPPRTISLSDIPLVK